MRIAHLADTHLGFHQFRVLDPERGINQREADVYASWHRAIEIAIERDVDLVVHAGDLFDSSRPSPRALAEALAGFASLREAEIPTVVIAGNHSTPRFRSAGSVFRILELFGVLAAWEGARTMEPVNGIAVAAIPHDPDPERLAATIAEQRPAPGAEYSILVTHAGIGSVRQGYGEIGEVEIDPEVVARSEFDYIALGHLHAFQAPQINAVYPGSLERLDFKDVGGIKAVLEVNLAAAPGTDGYLTRHPIAARPVLDRSIACAGLEPADVLGEARASTANQDLTGAVVRVRLDGIARDVYQALDRRAMDELFEACLHHQVAVGPGGLLASVGEPDEAPIAFDDFARAQIPVGVDATTVLRVAREYLREAGAAELEESAGEQ
jgi:DNA repair protein SbcD/Mre11